MVREWKTGGGFFAYLKRVGWVLLGWVSVCGCLSDLCDWVKMIRGSWGNRRHIFECTPIWTMQVLARWSHTTYIKPSNRLKQRQLKLSVTLWELVYRQICRKSLVRVKIVVFLSLVEIVVQYSLELIQWHRAALGPRVLGYLRTLDADEGCRVAEGVRQRSARGGTTGTTWGCSMGCITPMVNHWVNMI